VRTSREFFTVRRVSEALAEFRPARRARVEPVRLEAALGRVPSGAVTAPHDLPGFARATVDGYAVRATDTFGASEGLPAYLTLAGSVRMGAGAEVEVAPGAAVAIPTGGALPAGADAVVMVEHTHEPMAGAVEVMRPAAPGDGLVRADEDAAAGAPLVPAGQPLRPQDLGMLAAAGVTSIEVHTRPRVGILSTGDEVVPPGTGRLESGQVRDATAVALSALASWAGGVSDARGIVPDDRAALTEALGAARDECDLVVVSAGSSVGARDETAAAVAALCDPGIWCHGLAIKPGKPTLLAECDGVPVIGLPGNPRSALVVFRLVGVPLVRLVGGVTTPPRDPAIRAHLARDVPSAAGRLDVVPVRLAGRDESGVVAAREESDGPDSVAGGPPDLVAHPLFGASALLSVLVAADGWVVVPEAETGLAAGAAVDVMLPG
jgi:molybdopterin molybdotransferase